MIRLIPPYVLEFLLFVVLMTLAGVVIHAVRRRWKVAPVEAEAMLPNLATDVRLHGVIRRMFRDPDQGVYLIEVMIGTRKLTFRPTDFGALHYKTYEDCKTTQTFALYALGTLQAGGAEAMRAQIADLDKATEPLDRLTRFVPAGQFPNDYAVIGRIVSEREGIVSDAPVRVYHVQVENQDTAPLFLDIAVEINDVPPFAVETYVHGSARLFGYITGHVTSTNEVM